MSKEVALSENNILEKIIEGKVFILSIALIGYLMFKSSFEYLIQNYLIDPVFSKIHSSLNFDCLVFGAIILAYFVFASRINRNYQVSIKKLYVLLFFAIIYSYYRFYIPGKWTFVDFNLIQGLHYFDITYLVFFSYSMLFLRNKAFVKEQSANEENGFKLDQPVSHSGLDLYGRKQFAEEIAKKVCVNYDTKNSIAIAIDGPWGSGKTSFIYMIKEFIGKQENSSDKIIIDFHPWKSTSPQQIIADFFDVFTEQIQHYNGNLSSQINEYAKSLTKIDDNYFTKAIDVVFDLFEKDKSKESQYNKINRSLEKIDKKIIVIIDDIDRLDKKEIVEVIRLIRNTASFNNTIFIVTYEREYILNAIKELNEHKFQQYLDKIFQFEFTLPSFEKTILKNQLLNDLLPYLNEDHKPALNTVLFPASGIKNNVDIFDQYIKTKRDVIRYVNSFLFDYKFIKDEIEIQDFAILQLLKLKYPDVFDLLFEKRGKFLSPSQSTNFPGAQEYVLKRSNDAKDRNNNNTGPVILLQYLQSGCHSVNYNDCNIGDIIQIVEHLFSSGLASLNYNRKDQKSISIIDNFYKYFANRVLAGEISISEFNEAFSMSYEEFVERIDDWLRKGFENDVIIRLSRKKTTELRGREEYEKLIKAIFYFGNKTAIGGSRYLFDTRELYNMLYQEEGSNLVKYAYGGNFEEFKNFIQNLLSDAKSPFAFESWFIRTIKDRNFGDFILNEDILYDIQLKYLEDYLNLVQHFDRNIWTLIYDNKLVEKVENTGGSFQIHPKHNKKITPLILNFIEQYKLLDEFISSLLQWETFDQELIGLSIDSINAVFGDLQSFEEYLYTQQNNSKSNYIKEFINFYEAFKTGGNKYLNYKFQSMPLPKKR